MRVWIGRVGKHGSGQKMLFIIILECQMGVRYVWVTTTSLVGRPTSRLSRGTLFSPGLLSFRLQDWFRGRLLLPFPLAFRKVLFVYSVYFDAPLSRAFNLITFLPIKNKKIINIHCRYRLQIIDYKYRLQIDRYRRIDVDN